VTTCDCESGELLEPTYSHCFQSLMSMHASASGDRTGYCFAPSQLHYVANIFPDGETPWTGGKLMMQLEL
jgi:hypothetical protein